MDKPVVNNGFTIIEMLIVLLILVCFTIPFVKPDPSFDIFMKKMRIYSIICQEKAFLYKQNQNVSIQEHQAVFDDFVYVYPETITCEPVSFHYNSNGNISQALSYSCQSLTQQKTLIYQLGSGRVRYE
ncbi:prepilin-type N-terminal cleavage/methylation domain-containing protein [Floccifex sp.]|uniref:prepilin-type N-terminal cleavage/methylation domain-containing protein n=1 Tax=Floccifex sp. TaxID=2815810 RepID=UPI003F09A2CB